MEAHAIPQGVVEGTTRIDSNPSELVKQGKQSPNWDKFQNRIGFISEGFPFKEGFPPSKENTTSNNKDQFYDLRLRSGEIVTGRPSYSPFEGGGAVEWRIENGKSVNPAIVVAWKENNKQVSDDESMQETQQILQQERHIDVNLVQDTNCLASVMAMAINTLSSTGRRYPFTGHEIRQYLHSTRIPEIKRGLTRLSQQQSIYDVAVREKYILDTDPPLEKVISSEIDNNNLVALVVSANEWQKNILHEDIQGKPDELHMVLVNGYSKKTEGFFLTVQDPMGHSLDVEFGKVRKTLKQYYPDSSFTIEDMKDFKLYDMIFIWSRAN